MSQPILGIDVSKESMDICLVIVNKRVSAVFGNNRTGHLHGEIPRLN